MNADEQKRTAHAIAVGRWRFFLLKSRATRSIAFDFADALSFEGKRAVLPVCRGAHPRNSPQRREAGAARVAVSAETAQKLRPARKATDLWEVLLAAGSLDYAVDAAIGAREPAFVANMRFSWRRRSTIFITSTHFVEGDEQKRAFLLG